MTSIKISGALSNASKDINVIFNGNSDLNEFIGIEEHTAQDDIRTFSNGNQTLRVLYGYPEPMFLVDDVIKIGIIKNPQMAIDRAQETNSAVFIMRKVNYEDFEDKPFLFTNFRGACAAAMSSFHDNPYQAAFSLSEILDFIQHHFLEAIEQELGMKVGRRSSERRTGIDTEEGGKKMTNVITTYSGDGAHNLTVWNRNGELLFDVEDIFNIAGFQDPNLALSEVLFSDAPDVMFVKRRIEQEEPEFDSQLFTNLPGAMAMAERTFYYHPVRQEPPDIEAVLDMVEMVVVPALEDDSARDLDQQIGKGRQAIHMLRHPAFLN